MLVVLEARLRWNAGLGVEQPHVEDPVLISWCKNVIVIVFV